MRSWLLVGALWIGGSAFAAEPLKIEDEGDDGSLIIRGKVQKPEVVVVIRRENLDRGFALDLKESFLERIVEALRLPPF
jgi:hypothetical protein